ncbi:MAG: DUF4878 domain-containing protein [Prevotellaceae bacterium]|jgi:hypothetical protein|nr:DUF4878 domain-containing protein [Prevotellaceae bacterium]
MRTLKTLALVIAASLLLFACGGSSPESVVSKYLDAVKAVDLKAAKECLSKPLAVEFEEMTRDFSEDEIKELKEENANMNVKVVRSEIDGETAVVYLEEAHSDHSHERKIPLIKEDGQWKMNIIY